MSLLQKYKRKWIAVDFLIEWVYIVKMKIPSSNEKMLPILFYLCIINFRLM